MTKFILIVNLLQLIVCWLVYLPAYIMYKTTERISHVAFLKIALFSAVFLGTTDMLELIVLVVRHQPTNWLTWVCPVLWTIIGISYHKEYLKLKEEEVKPTPPSEHP